MPVASHLHSVRPWTTRDQSEIRELVHPSLHGNRNQSLAEARVRPGQRTHLHRHHASEEIYHITQGQGRMTLEQECFAVSAGDSIVTPPGSRHCIENTGADDLRLLCLCAPAYSHADTELLDE